MGAIQAKRGPRAVKASIVIPNLNGAGWLKDSIESIRAQTFRDFELIVVDNGSEDESLAIARSYVGQEGYTHICLICWNLPCY